MAIELKQAGSLGTASSRYKSIVFSCLFLVVVFVILSSEPLLFDKPQSEHPHAAKKLHSSSQQTVSLESPYDRPLVLFVYSESDNARDNLQFFVNKGLHAGADFIFIFNGQTDATALVPSHLENIKIVQRENTCFDIGAQGEVLAKDNLWQRYKRFITMNASVRGPFLPMWSNECWTDAFLDKITDEVKLVGLTYQCDPTAHVQSMFLATDSVGMGILLDPDLAYSVPMDTWPWGGPELPTGYSVCYADYGQAVHAEIGMARLIRSKGYEVETMITSTHVVAMADYCSMPGANWDTLSAGGYFGSNIHPYEVVFAKANRNIDDNLLGHLTNWHNSMNESSWDKCRRYATT